jgi:hypothetical protein
LTNAPSTRLPLACLLACRLRLLLNAPTTAPLLGCRLFGGRTARKADGLDASEPGVMPSGHLQRGKSTLGWRCSM